MVNLEWSSVIILSAVKLANVSHYVPDGMVVFWHFEIDITEHLREFVPECEMKVDKLLRFLQTVFVAIVISYTLQFCEENFEKRFYA